MLHDAVIYASQVKYMKVASSTVDDSGGFVVPNGVKIGIHRIRLNGADPNAYVVCVWDYGGLTERVFASTKGDVDHEFDIALADYQITGDGAKKLNIVIENNNDFESPYIGGSWEAVLL